MKNKKIKVGIASEQKVNLEFIRDFKAAVRDFKAAVRGKKTRTQENLYFLDADTLLKTLSNQRLVLIQTLHDHPPLSIRRLASLLKRNYKNVYTDVKLLQQAGLIQSTLEHTVFVPWDKIQTEIDLAA